MYLSVVLFFFAVTLLATFLPIPWASRLDPKPFSTSKLSC